MRRSRATTTSPTPRSSAPSSGTRTSCGRWACRSRSAASTCSSTTSRATGSCRASSRCRPIDLDAEEAAGRRGRRPGLAARQHGGVDPERAGQASGGRRSSRTPLSWPLWSRRCRPPSRPSTAVERGAGPQPGRFTYRDGERRTLEPWGMTAVARAVGTCIGRDTDRDATRMFKLSRITDQPRKALPPRRLHGARATSTCAPWPGRSLHESRPHQPGWASAPARRRALRPTREPAMPARALPSGFEVFAVGYGDL